MKKSTFKRVLTLATALVLVFSVALSAVAIQPVAPYYFTDPDLDDQDQTPMGNATIFDAEYISGSDTYVLINQPEYYTKPDGDEVVGTVVGYEVFDMNLTPSPDFVNVWSKGFASIPGELIIHNDTYDTDYFIVKISVSIFNITTKEDEGVLVMPGYLDVSKLP